MIATSRETPDEYRLRRTKKLVPRYIELGIPAYAHWIFDAVASTQTLGVRPAWLYRHDLARMFRDRVPVAEVLYAAVIWGYNLMPQRRMVFDSSGNHHNYWRWDVMHFGDMGAHGPVDIVLWFHQADEQFFTRSWEFATEAWFDLFAVYEKLPPWQQARFMAGPIDPADANT